jgi:hypothetical protein
MIAPKKSIQALARELFNYHPDYILCKNLAENVRAENITLASAIQQLAARTSAAESHRGEIEERLDQRTVPWNGGQLLLKQMSLRQLIALDDSTLTEVVRFYFKYPYAHKRTRRSKWLPQWVRSVPLRVLLGHARQRNLELDFETYFEMIDLI